MTQAFNLSQLANNVNSSGQLDSSVGLSGTISTSNLPTVPVSKGGTGLTTLTANNVILGNGSSNPNFVSPSTSGNVLTSNGTTWVSTAPSITSSSTQLAKVWANINPSSGLINASYNVSSVSGGASWTVNFTNPLTDANYSCVFGYTNISGDIYNRTPYISAFNASYVTFNQVQNNPTNWCIACFR